VPPPDVFHNFFDFLGCVAAWIRARLQGTSRRERYIVLVLQASLDFHGVGAYTAIELCAIAGMFAAVLSIFLMIIQGVPFDLTEAEVFDDPSRTIRICLAYYVFAHRSHTKLWYVKCLVI
jgi:hypothetical protein